MKKIVLILIIFLSITTKESNADLLSSKWLGDWGYDYGNNHSAYSGGLSITKCKNNKCKFNISTVSGPTFHTCSMEDILVTDNSNIGIVNLNYEKWAPSKNDFEKDSCKVQFILSKDKKKLTFKPEEKCELNNFCGMRGRFGKNYEKENLKSKTYKTSFKCEELEILSEAKICTNKKLAKLDLDLSEILKKKPDLLKTQLDWIDTIRNKNPYVDNIERAYLSRIYEVYKKKDYTPKEIKTPYSFIGKWWSLDWVVDAQNMVQDGKNNDNLEITNCTASGCKFSFTDQLDLAIETKEICKGKGRLKIKDAKQAIAENIKIKFDDKKVQNCTLDFKLTDLGDLEIKSDSNCKLPKSCLGKYNMNIYDVAYQGSFDCSKSYSIIDRAICSNKGLASLDLELTDLYSQIFKVNPSIRKSQKKWIKSRNKCSDSVSCIKNKYLERIIELYKQK